MFCKTISATKTETGEPIVNSYRHRTNDLLTESNKTNYERTIGQLTIWLTENNCLTVTVDRSKRSNDITSLYSQQYNDLTDRRPITSRLNWPIRSITRVSRIPSTDVIQLTLILKMTTAQVVKMLVTVNNNSPIQDYVHPDDHSQPTYEIITVFSHPWYCSYLVSKLWEAAETWLRYPENIRELGHTTIIIIIIIIIIINLIIIIIIIIITVMY